MNKVAIYTRVSTEEQVKDGFSLQAQERALKDFCEKNNYDIYDIYTDEGVSGRSIKKRKELSRLLSDAEGKKFDLVLIYKLDRLSRTVKDAYTIIDVLVKNDIGVLSISEKHINFSTAQQRAMFGMSMVFAQLEVEQISERVVFGMREAARSKKAIFDLPYGYRNNNGTVEIVEDQAEVVNAEGKKFDLVLIYKLDRLSRTVKDAYTIIDVLVKNDIGVLSISEKHINFSTAQQRAMFGMSMVFAQLEVEQISERVVFGMREAARSKKAIFDLPYGYRNNNGTVEIVEDQAEVVKEIFALYKDGLGSLIWY